MNDRPAAPFSRLRCWLIFLGLLMVLPLRAAEAPATTQPPSNRRMVERIDLWTQLLGGKNIFAPSDEMKALQQALARAQSAREEVVLEGQLAAILLQFGQLNEGLAILTNIHRKAVLAGVRLPAREQRLVRFLTGMAYLRLGESENCLDHHNPDSCLLPIQGAGQHGHPRGSENAMAIFQALSLLNTNDYGFRWLYNVAAMTLGKYPQEVDPSLLIPPASFASEAQIPRFPEIALQAGLAVRDISGASITEDFDGDGLLDVVLTSWLTEEKIGPTHYFKNLGNGRFEERTIPAGLEGYKGGLNAIQADYNNDGWTDFFILRGAWLADYGLQPDSLLRNNGDGTFTDVTEQAGLLFPQPTLSAAWFDADQDGWLDLFVGVETQPISRTPKPCQLFLNNQDGTFTEYAKQAGVDFVGFVRGVTAGDYDNDGWIDLYLSNLGATNVLFRNDGPKAVAQGARVHFTNLAPQAGVTGPGQSFPCWFWDYDNDGWLDLFVADYTFQYTSHETIHDYTIDRLGLPHQRDRTTLFRNNRNGTFADVGHATRVDHIYLAMGANFGDIDNDGWLDIYLGTGTPSYAGLVPNEMLRNHQGQFFQNVTAAGGFGHIQKGHGISFADLNNDGHQDVLANMGGAYPADDFYDALFANPGSSNHWITLKLIGTRSNRSAIGARIKVTARTGQGSRDIHRVVGWGGSFGASPLRQEIGLGDAQAIESVEIWWPTSATTNRYSGLQRDRFYEITEGRPDAKTLELPSFRWDLSPPAPAMDHADHSHH